jgi:hypothetical protein
LVCALIPTARWTVVESPGASAKIAAPATNATIVMVERLAIMLSDAGPARTPGQSSQVFGNGLELIDDGHRGFSGSVRRGVEAVVNMIVDQCSLCFADGFFDGLKLLGKIETGSSFTSR